MIYNENEDKVEKRNVVVLAIKTLASEINELFMDTRNDKKDILTLIEQGNDLTTFEAFMELESNSDTRVESPVTQEVERRLAHELEMMTPLAVECDADEEAADLDNT